MSRTVRGEVHWVSGPEGEGPDVSGEWEKFPDQGVHKLRPEARAGSESLRNRQEAGGPLLLSRTGLPESLTGATGLGLPHQPPPCQDS